IRRILKQAPPDASTVLMRPVLCNLRLLAGDRATDGEPVLETTKQEGQKPPVTPPHGVFTPNPPFPAAAKKKPGVNTLYFEAVLDPEGCRASAKLLKPVQPPADVLTDQTIASLRWWAYEPARYQGVPVAVKYTLTTQFAVGD